MILTMKKYLIIIALFLGLVACAPDTPEFTPELSVAESKIEAVAAQETYTLAIESNTKWSVECEAEWIFCSPVRGEGDAEIEVSVLANKSYDERTTTITIKGNGIADEINIPVTQASAKGLLVETTVYEIGAEGGNIVVDLQTNAELTATIEADWITLAEPTRALEARQMTFVVAANSITEPRTATIILSGEGVKDETLTVTQKAYTEPAAVFANEAFKAFLLNKGYDTDGDNEFWQSELDAITSITLWRRVEKEYFTFETDAIDDLSDLQYLRNLEELDIQGVPETLTSLDLSKNTKLRKLNCAYTAIASFDLNNNTELVELNLSATPIASLDLSNNTKLSKLELRSCASLTSVDVSALSHLTMLNCTYSNVSALNLANNTNLVALYCSGCGLTELNISALAKLERLVCDDNKLTSLDASNNLQLKSLTCMRNNITSLAVSGLSNLKRLSISHNPISELSLVGNTALNYLHTAFTSFTAIDATPATALLMINANDSQLAGVDLSKNTALRGLRLNNNVLTSLDISKNSDLRYLWADGNSTLSVIRVGDWFNPLAVTTFYKDNHTKWSNIIQQDNTAMDDMTESNGSWAPAN